MVSAVTIELHAGSSEEVTIDLTDGADAPITSFTGWTATAQVRYEPKAESAVLFEWSTTNGLLTLVPSATESVAVLAMPAPAISLAWIWRLAWFDLALIDGGGNPAGRPVRGIVRVVPGITR